MANGQAQGAIEDKSRDPVAGNLARWIVYGAVIYLTLMSILFIATVILPTAGQATTAIDKDTVTAWKDIVGVTLPVFAAWVGTILAFYFAKENFEAANKSAREIFHQMSPNDKLRSVSAKEVMVPRNSISDIKLDSDQSPANISLEQDVIPKLHGKFTRLPIFGQNDKILCMVHESAVHKFLYKARQANATTSSTLQDLMQDAELGPLVVALAFVPEAATLGDAQEAMKKVQRCQDVFLTKNGQRDEPVLGWLTNADIAKQVEA